MELVKGKLKSIIRECITRERYKRRAFVTYVAAHDEEEVGVLTTVTK